MVYDPMDTASSVYGIVGTGISLGVLSGMTGMAMRSMERNVYDRNFASKREQPYRPRSNSKRGKKGKKTRQTRLRNYEERPRYGYQSRAPKLNIPSYWRL